MDRPPKPLRILAIVNLPWDSRLGAPRVWMELADQWRAAGHTVEQFSLSEAFPGSRPMRVVFALQQLLFIRKAAAYVREHGHRFDVIDALIGTLPYSKRSLRFQGVIAARSVGLYLLYDRFEHALQERYPRRGKLIGRLLYGFTRRRISQASEQSIRHADLINVPNQLEADCVRTEIAPSGRIVVQPYGLTEAQRRALSAEAQPAEARLAQQRVCFIGMWSPRKGAFDWPAIIRRVRAEIPAAQFRFLGTMLDAATIRSELEVDGSEQIELISNFQPDELPALLSDCTVAAFPSYAEGFGLAVIEQLAAGLPVIAYDTPGPRDILQPNFPDALIATGDADTFAAALCRVMSLDAKAYDALSQRSIATAATYSWPQIARDTIDIYQELRERSDRPVVFVQPFGVGGPGGGPRILRALLEDAPLPWRSICTAPEKPRPRANEIHLASRPFWGRIEFTRLAWLPQGSSRFFAKNFRERLRRACREMNARAIHVVPHAGLDFVEAQKVAHELSLPFLVSLHDDLAYTAIDQVSPGKLQAAMDRAWKDAAARFVISEALGREYCRRYGERPFRVVTDGVAQLGELRAQPASNQLRIYFMGLFHRGYERNLRALLEGIALFERTRPGTEVSVTLRCEHVRPQVLAGVKPVTILPFAHETQVQKDLEAADLLYLPLPFGDKHADFAQYSLSTKMVTYVGAGLPILYHGPETSAASQLLTRHHAAIPVNTLDPTEIARALERLSFETCTTVARNALELARREFMLADQRQRFWGAISECLK